MNYFINIKMVIRFDDQFWIPNSFAWSFAFDFKSSYCWINVDICDWASPNIVVEHVSRRCSFYKSLKYCWICHNSFLIKILGPYSLSKFSSTFVKSRKTFFVRSDIIFLIGRIISLFVAIEICNMTIKTDDLSTFTKPWSRSAAEPIDTNVMSFWDDHWWNFTYLRHL